MGEGKQNRGVGGASVWSDQFEPSLVSFVCSGFFILDLAVIQDIQLFLHIVYGLFFPLLGLYYSYILGSRDVRSLLMLSMRQERVSANFQCCVMPLCVSMCAICIDPDSKGIF